MENINLQMILTKIIEGSCTLAVASISPADGLILTAILSIFGYFPLIFPHMPSFMRVQYFPFLHFMFVSIPEVYNVIYDSCIH